MAMLAALFMLVLLLVALFVVMYGVIIYNGLVRLRNNIDKAWSNIDVLIKQRYDELPKLVKVCEGYMKHERDTLQRVIEARSMMSGAHSVSETAQADSFLSGALKSLFAVAENYPELKANQNFLALQGRISSLESQIADRREYFNESVNLFNIRIEQIPDVLIAKPLQYKPRDMWSIDPTERQDVEISFSFA